MKIWLCDLTYDQQVVAADTMPTNIAYLTVYVKHQSKFDNDFKLFKYPGKLLEAINTKELPDVIGFSNFSWNSRLSLKLAHTIKEAKPNIVIVFGGLQYPDDKSEQIKFLKENKIIDFYVYKEGELAFLNLINQFHVYKLDIEKVKKEKEIVGVHYIKPNGDAYISPPAQRIKRQSDHPSPYTTGVLDEFFDHQLMPVLTTNRGCPFTCTFCSEGSNYYNVVNKVDRSRVNEEIEYIAKKISNDKTGKLRRDIYISDSNFGMFKEDLEVAEKFAEVKAKYGWPDSLKVTTGKNHKIRVLEVFAKIPESIDTELTGSVQSMDPEVLDNIKRTQIKNDSLNDMALESGKRGKKTYSDVILGLPGDSLEKHKNSVKALVDSKYDNILSRQLILLKGSEMSSLESLEKYGFKTKFRILTKSYGCYNYKENKNIAVSEIEETVVGGKNLSYEDYIEARNFNLVTHIFYNHNFLQAFLKILDSSNIKRSEWLEKIFQVCKKDAKFKKLMGQFQKESEDELWESKEDLIEHISKEENVKKIINGDYGSNLLAKYRIIAIYDYLKEICNIAQKITKQVLIEKNKNAAQLDAFLEELEKYEFLKKKSIFTPDLEDDQLKVNFDIVKFEDITDNLNLENLKFNKEKTIKFFREKETSKLINNNAKLYGLSYSGIYKSMTRGTLQKRYRAIEYI